VEGSAIIRLRVLIAEEHPAVAEELRAMLERAGHTLAGTAHDGRGALARAESLTSDLVLLNAKMSGLDGLEAIRRIMAHRPVPIVLVMSGYDPDLIERAILAGVMGFLVRPVAPAALGPAIALAAVRFADLMALRREAEGLKEALVLRQQVQRAKGVLTHRMRLSEAEAHKKLQAIAHREHCSLVEAAGRVVVADRFFDQLDALA
jgi:two-component system, response regulator PdtaR